MLVSATHSPHEKGVFALSTASKDVNPRDAYILSSARDAAEASKYDEKSVKKLLTDYAVAMSAFQSADPNTPSDSKRRKEAGKLYALISKLHKHRHLLDSEARSLLELFFWASGSGAIVAAQAATGAIVAAPGKC